MWQYLDCWQAKQGTVAEGKGSKWMWRRGKLASEGFWEHKASAPGKKEENEGLIFSTALPWRIRIGQRSTLFFKNFCHKSQDLTWDVYEISSNKENKYIEAQVHWGGQVLKICCCFEKQKSKYFWRIVLKSSCYCLGNRKHISNYIPDFQGSSGPIMPKHWWPCRCLSATAVHNAILGCQTIMRITL